MTECSTAKSFLQTKGQLKLGFTLTDLHCTATKASKLKKRKFTHRIFAVRICRSN